MDSLNQEVIIESAIIASLLVKNSALDEISDTIKSSDFTSNLHRNSYESLSQLISEGKNVDVIYLAKVLSEKTGEDESTIFINLYQAIGQTFAPDNIKHYADMLRQKSIDRKMLSAAHQIILNVKENRPHRLDYAQQVFSKIAEELPYQISKVDEVLKEVIESIDQRCRNKNKLTGLSTGFIDLDKKTQGLHGGDLIILAGRPAMGKTLLGMNIAEHVAINENKTVIIFSLEMSKNQLVERSVSSIGQIENFKIRSGNITDEDFQKITSIFPKFEHANLYIDDCSSISVIDIRAKCRRLKKEKDLSLVIVDYLSLMNGEGENETIRLGNISRGLKLLARDLNVPIIAIAQLNRSVENQQDKRPKMSDIRQSGAIEQDADLIGFIFREEVYDQTTPNKEIAELIIAKHRNGDIGTIYLAFKKHLCRFDNLPEYFTPQLKQDPIIRKIGLRGY